MGKDAVAPSIRGSAAISQKKIAKNELLNRVFSAYLQTEMVSPTVKKGKGALGFHLTATGRHLPYGITQCYLLPDTS